MASFNKYNKTKRSHNNNDDNDDKNNKNIDTSYPTTITVIDSTQGKNVFVDDDEPAIKICFFIPERTFVIIILSLYTFFGILITFTGFADLASSSKPLYQAQYGITAIVSAFLAVAGVVGLTAIRNNNANLLRRLSVFFWILTVFMLILNATSYVISIASKHEAVKKCQNDPNRVVGEDGVKLDLDCDKIVNYILIRDAFELLVVEIIWIYLTYTIVCYSRKLITKSKTLRSQSKFSNHGVYTYQIHATNIPPTSDDWKPQKYIV